MCSSVDWLYAVAFARVTYGIDRWQSLCEIFTPDCVTIVEDAEEMRSVGERGGRRVRCK